MEVPWIHVPYTIAGCTQPSSPFPKEKGRAIIDSAFTELEMELIYVWIFLLNLEVTLQQRIF